MEPGRDADSLRALRRRCAEVLRAALPPSERLAALDTAAITEALLGALRFEAYADARPALYGARRAGARIVVVSNWDVSLPEVLERVGLAPLVDGVVTSAAVGLPSRPGDLRPRVGRRRRRRPSRRYTSATALTRMSAARRRAGSGRCCSVATGDPEPPDPGGVVTVTGLAQLDWP